MTELFARAKASDDMRPEDLLVEEISAREAKASGPGAGIQGRRDEVNLRTRAEGVGAAPPEDSGRNPSDFRSAGDARRKEKPLFRRSEAGVFLTPEMGANGTPRGIAERAEGSGPESRRRLLCMDGTGVPEVVDPQGNGSRRIETGKIGRNGRKATGRGRMPSPVRREFTSVDRPRPRHHRRPLHGHGLR